jgi:hypothetical protein
VRPYGLLLRVIPFSTWIPFHFALPCHPLNAKEAGFAAFVGITSRSFPLQLSGLPMSLLTVLPLIHIPNYIVHRSFQMKWIGESHEDLNLTLVCLLPARNTFFSFFFLKTKFFIGPFWVCYATVLNCYQSMMTLFDIYYWMLMGEGKSRLKRDLEKAISICSFSVLFFFVPHCSPSGPDHPLN